MPQPKALQKTALDHSHTWIRNFLHHGRQPQKSCGGRTKPGSVKRTASPGDGPNAAPGPRPPRISARDRPISTVRSARLKARALVVPSNITLMPLPPKCPDLNPVENVWQFIRDNWLSNRVFKSYDDILDQCCFAWNRLTDQPWRIMSLGLRTWAHRF
jgi:hypothetical protein